MSSSKSRRTSNKKTASDASEASAAVAAAEVVVKGESDVTRPDKTIKLNQKNVSGSAEVADTEMKDQQEIKAKGEEVSAVLRAENAEVFSNFLEFFFICN